MISRISTEDKCKIPGCDKNIIKIFIEFRLEYCKNPKTYTFCKESDHGPAGIADFCGNHIIAGKIYCETCQNEWKLNI